MFTVQNQQFELIEDYREGWDETAFQERYSEVLNKYDYVVGDWGHEQLRLRGFFRDDHKKATFDTKASAIYDYIIEYCNFGCAYFVVKNLGAVENETKDEETADETL
ncbi:uncharacterized protein YutD [Salsuginibacillus halophilus]|uniref:Uncharacterized protein YutD n=1 Tax=Salsuginibacillus halophilus TaxID=517424 RepID=A0A2P8HE10_9BACI|nr:YutD family protein [Salsuginibacillus halophilus]PSL44445.1 uncharacterized protein YutD [Salsuginibacillus halophilus]